MAKKPLLKEELVARLKAIAADETPREREIGAMCYSIMSPPEKHINCDMCGEDICYSDWNTHDTITEIVEKMAALGYDVKVETACHSCAEKVKKELYPDMKSEDDEDFDWEKDIWLSDINHIFFFKALGETEYHRAIANYKDSYRSLLALLQNKPMYYDSHDGNHYIDEEKDTLEFMTGIKFDI